MNPTDTLRHEAEYAILKRIDVCSQKIIPCIDLLDNYAVDAWVLMYTYVCPWWDAVKERWAPNIETSTVHNHQEVRSRMSAYQ